MNHFKMEDNETKGFEKGYFLTFKTLLLILRMGLSRVFTVSALCGSETLLYMSYTK